MTPAEFIDDFPEFATTNPAVIQRWIDRAAPYFDVARWGDFYVDGLGYWVAHKLTMRATIAASPMARTATSKRVGDVSVSHDAGLLQAAADEPFMATTYGQEYLRLVQSVGTGALAV